MVVVQNAPSEGSTREKGQEFRIVLKSIVSSVGIRFIFLFLMFCFIIWIPFEMRLRTKRRAEFTAIIRSRFRLLIFTILGVLVKVFLISILQEFIMLSLIICGKLRLLPFLKPLPRLLITFVHVLPGLFLPLFLLLSLLSILSLPVHLIQVLLAERVALCLGLQPRVCLLQLLKLFLKQSMHHSTKIAYRCTLGIRVIDLRELEILLFQHVLRECLAWVLNAVGDLHEATRLQSWDQAESNRGERLEAGPRIQNVH